MKNENRYSAGMAFEETVDEYGRFAAPVWDHQLDRPVVLIKTADQDMSEEIARRIAQQLNAGVLGDWTAADRPTTAVS